MDFNACAQCGVEIAAQGIHFRGRSFCCDECCEEFEASVSADDEPDEAALSAGGEDDLDDDFGYCDGDDEEEEFDDDDFEIKLDDF